MTDPLAAEEAQRVENAKGYAHEKLMQLESLAAKARGNLRIAKIEIEVAEAHVETQEQLVKFAEAAVAYQRQQVEEAGSQVTSVPDPAPTDVSPPQDDPPGAGTPPAPPASSQPPAAPPAAPPPSLVDAPAPRTRARTEWNMDRAREVLRKKGVIKNSDVVPLIGSVAAARIALQKLVDRGEAQCTGQRGGTRYHWQERIEDEAVSGSTHTEDGGVSGFTHTEPEDPPAGERRYPVSEGPPPERADGGRGRTSQGEGQEPSFQGLMHSRLVIKPMSLFQMLEEWPERSEQEVRQALGENMKAGDVVPKHKGDETRYHGRG